MIDTHCHLYLEDFIDDAEAVIARAAAAGVERFYLPSIDSHTTEAMLAFEKQFSGKCFAMMGIHPCSINETIDNELAHVQDWLSKRRFAAIGEIGLDFYHDASFKEQQYAAFHRQAEWALQYNMPIVIHSRSAMQETIDVIDSYKDKGLRGIFHCFSGSEVEAQKILATGFYLGIGGVVTYKNAGLAEAIKNIPLEHLVLETDAPYLTPVPHRGKRNEPAYLEHVVSKLAEIKNISKEEVAAITTANAKKIFGN
jgi:TatD DNase family protein